jgi:demethylmenaquinone methyltransferase/2-methoxy-6-polyprenyl-1,4-benzoquinol methylase
MPFRGSLAAVREALRTKRAGEVRSMFGRIAHRYDLLNRLLSFGQDVRWRRVLARRVGAGDHGPVLDLCTGTGDVALSCSAAAATVASDFSLPMLIRARRKAAARRRALPLVAADALRLPLRDGAVGTVTVAFGVRNFERLEAGLAEVGRVLRPGGLLLVLEFSRPRGVLAPLLAWWAGSVPPLLGRALSGDGEAYRYLPRSVAEFPSGHDFEAVLARVGYEGVRHRRLTGGVATLYEARTRADGGTPAGSGQEPARPGSGR